mgnify:CR=1 FL=1
MNEFLEGLQKRKFQIINYNGSNRKWEKYIDKIGFEGTNLIFYLNDDNQPSNSKKYTFKTKDMELMIINKTIEKIKLMVEESNNDELAKPAEPQAKAVGPPAGGKRSRRKRRKISRKKKIKTISKKKRKINRRIKKTTRKRSIKTQRR